MRFRALRADEVECRIGQVSKSGKGLSLLLYKDARCDANILDETAGPERWQCRFYERKGTLFCSVGIEYSAGWVWKDDAGSPSNMEAAKGEASDAFKRACFKWGIGRELYTAPFIWVPADKCSIKDGKCYDRFHVTDLETVDGKIARLIVAKEGYGTVYAWPRGAQEEKQRDYSEVTALKERLAKATGATLEETGKGIVAKYGNPKDMGDAEFACFVAALTAQVKEAER